MKIIAWFFRMLFKIPFFRKRYFGFYKRIFKPLKLFRGMSVICRYDKNLLFKADLDEWIQQHVYFLGNWDEPGTGFLKKQLGKNDVFMDIGANVGCYSLLASKLVGPGGKVHSFEPVSGVFERLQANIQLNGLENIISNRAAVYEKSGTLDLYVSAGENAGMSSIFHHDTESGMVETVTSISIDEYVESLEIDRISMVKIDIEGAELFALKGMEKSLLRFKPVIIMEISDEIIQNNLVNKSEALELLERLDYKMKRITGSGDLADLSGQVTGYPNFAFIPARGRM